MPEPDHARTLTASDLLALVGPDADPPDGPVVVDFWDPLCTSCRATLDTVDALACRLDGRAVVATLNVRAHTEVAREIGIESVPTLIVFRDGTPQHVLQGAEKIQSFSQRIEQDLFNGKPADC
jgi:thioredoxin 1